MNRLNRKIEYALMALKLMSQKTPGELTSAKEVSEKTSAPFDVTARVLQLLAQHDILRSEHGAHGGYTLVKDLSRIRFFDLMEILLGPVGVAKCLVDEQGCDLVETCNIQSPMAILNRKLIEFYKNLSVGELLRSKENDKRVVAKTKLEQVKWVGDSL